ASAVAAGGRRRDPVLGDLRAGRLQHRVRPHQGRSDEHDAPLRDVFVRARAPERSGRPGRGGLPVPVPDLARGGVRPAPAGPPVDDAMSRSRARQLRPLFTLYLPVLPFVLFALFPLYFMLITSFKKNAELYDVNAVPFLIKRGVTLGHYQLLSQDTLFCSWFVNSLIVSVAATAICVVLG